MFLFPIAYILIFILSVRSILKKNIEGALLFLVAGLPIYTISLSVTYMYGFAKWVPVLQSFKEIIILVFLGSILLNLKKKIHFHLVDKLVLGFLLYTLLYVLLPIGQNSIMNKLLAIKGLSFGILIYFAGRLFDPAKLYVNKYFHYICAVLIAATCLTLYEVITYRHIQTFSGYADYNYHYFNQDPSGSYGLSWTFEIESGRKRFASFFANPLEFGSAVILTTAVFVGLYTTNKNRLKIDPFGIIVIACITLSIIFSLSRSYLITYFILLYVYALLARKKFILRFVYACVSGAILYMIFFKGNDIKEYAISTLNFTNPSSLGHLLAWLEGITTIFQRPLGIGLGESGGRLSGVIGETVGGENQFLIIGVQTGIISLTLYLWIYFAIIKNSWRWRNKLKGKEKKICIAILLIKIGFIIPSFTSELESYLYVSYMTWFLSGVFISIISRKKDPLIQTG